MWTEFGEESYPGRHNTRRNTAGSTEYGNENVDGKAMIVPVIVGDAGAELSLCFVGGVGLAFVWLEGLTLQKILGKNMASALEHESVAARVDG